MPLSKHLGRGRLFRHDGPERLRTPEGALISCEGSLTIAVLNVVPHQLELSEVLDDNPGLFD